MGGVGTYAAPSGLSRADGVASPEDSAFVSRMQAPVPATAAEELHAALLQAGLTAALRLRGQVDKILVVDGRVGW